MRQQQTWQQQVHAHASRRPHLSGVSAAWARRRFICWLLACLLLSAGWSLLAYSAEAGPGAASSAVAAHPAVAPAAASSALGDASAAASLLAAMGGAGKAAVPAPASSTGGSPGPSATNDPPAAAVPADPWAPFDTRWFDNVTVDDGLPHSTTTSIVQDRSGLIWIGSFGGLVRYDGYRMQVYGQDGDSGDALSDAYVRALAPLADGSLLIGTNAGGLERFDPRNNRFKPYPIGRGGTASEKIFALAPARDNGYWIASEGGLDHLDLARDTITPVFRGGHGVAARSFAVLEDARGNLWLGNNGGLFVRYAGHHAFVRPAAAQAAGEAAALLHDQVWSLYQDREGRLWVGTGQSGALYLDADGRAHTVDGLSGQHGMAQRRTVRAFLETREGELWIATDGAGVVVYDPQRHGTRVFAHDPALPSSLPGDITRDLLQDRAGNVWVATELGAAHYDPQARTVLSLLPSPLQSHTLANPDVHCVFVDPRGRIWLGLGMGRIDVIDLAHASLIHLRLGGAQAERDVQAFVVAPDGSIWAGAQGVARIDPDSFAITPSLLPSLDGQLILSMVRDGDDVLIGNYDGIYRYDTHGGAMHHLHHDVEDPHSLIGDQVRLIVRMPGAWWFSTVNGISLALDGQSGFRNIIHDPRDRSSLPQDYVGTAVFDSHGRLWVSTFGGLAYLDHFAPQGPFRFGRVGTAEGLANPKVNAALVDSRDRIWASLANGMAEVEPDSLKVANLGVRDGLRIPSYVHRSAAVAPGGDLLFGGLGGLTVVRADRRRAPAPPAQLAVTQVQVDEHLLPYGALPAGGRALELPRQHHSLRIDFALLDYRAAQETRYSYRLDGFDERWIEIPHGNPPGAIYTNLPYGDYQLRLRAQTKGLAATTVESMVRIVVPPRWYETWWSRLCLLLLLAAIFLGLVSLRTHYLRRRAVLLQREIERRTLDLKAANARLDRLAGTDELTGSYNRRRFLELAGQARQAAQASGGPLAMVLIDLDEFKAVNDTYGHLAGDAVIRAAVQTVSERCPANGMLGRYGGEELVLCLPGMTINEAFELTERIREAMALRVIVHDSRVIRITVSAGVALMHADESLQNLLARADNALYVAKRAGRNRVIDAER